MASCPSLSAEGTLVRQRKMVPKVTPDFIESGMDNFGADLEHGDGEILSGSAANHVEGQTSPPVSSHANSNGSRPVTGCGSGSEFRETSLTEPLLHGDPSDSDEGVTPVPDHVPEIVLKEPDESSWQIALQVFFPYLVAGLGMVAAGLVLDKVQHWKVFVEVSEIFILVPALLGLKGNLEMTLASRLSTQANLGNMDTSKELWSMIGGNLALTQEVVAVIKTLHSNMGARECFRFVHIPSVGWQKAQAIAVGFLASVAAMIFGWIPEGKFSLSHAFLLCASSVMTAAIASFALGSVMIVVVVLSRKYKINPDNVATPIAASLGDLITLSLLSSLSALLYKAIDSQPWLAPTLLVVFLGLAPLWCWISHKNKYTHSVLYSGWTPIILAMVISSLGGLILDFTVANYNGIAVFQPVINGVGGNLVAVQASRLSTSLHMFSSPGTLPVSAVHGCPNPITTFFGKDMKARTARVLMLMVVPGHIIFMVCIHFLEAGHTSITAVFSVGYLTAAVVQVAVLLYLANWLVHILWKCGKDPDNFSIPYLTAMGDLLGTGLLAITFHILYVIGDKDGDVGD